MKESGCVFMHASHARQTSSGARSSSTAASIAMLSHNSELLKLLMHTGLG